MLERPLHGQFQRSAANDLARRWVNSIGLAVAVGVAYFVAARLSVGLLLPPEGVAVFWPAAGVSSGVLIALGPTLQTEALQQRAKTYATQFGWPFLSSSELMCNSIRDPIQAKHNHIPNQHNGNHARDG